MISHGFYSESNSSIIDAGPGSVLIGVPPTPELINIGKTKTNNEKLPQTCRYLLQQILEAPLLSGQQISTTELLKAQCEKLAVDAVINSLTVVFDCLNGKLSEHRNFEKWMRILLSEISKILGSLPEIRDKSDSTRRFCPARLEKMVLRVAKMTAENRSSMLQDLRAGRETEIDYIHGYLVARGEQLGLSCEYNQAFIRVITGKNRLK